MRTKNQRKGNGERPKVLGTGLIALDIVMNTTHKNTPFIGVGGTCGNVLTILSLLGWDSYPVARLNGSSASVRIQEDLQSWKVHLDFVQSSPPADPPVIIHTIRKDRHGQPYHRFSFNCPTCGSWLPNFKPIVAATAHEVNSAAINNRVFFFDRASRASITLAQASAKKGAVVVFEPISMSDKKLFAEAVEVSHILKYSNERFDVSPLDSLATTKPTLEIQTQGPKGLRFRLSSNQDHSNQWLELEAMEVTQLVDSAGSGDWCTAGLVNALCNEGLDGFRKMTKFDVINGLNFGQALASWSCQFEGARGGMYHLTETQYFEQLDQILSDFRTSDTAVQPLVTAAPHTSEWGPPLLRFNDQAVCSLSEEYRNACCL